MQYTDICLEVQYLGKRQQVKSELYTSHKDLPPRALTAASNLIDIVAYRPVDRQRKYAAAVTE
jgi:hypothetical protein